MGKKVSKEKEIPIIRGYTYLKRKPNEFQIVAKSCKSFKSLDEYKLFIDGYIHKNYCKTIPNEIIELIIIMYGKYVKNKFKWVIDNSNLKKLLSNPRNTDIILQDNEIKIYQFDPVTFTMTINGIGHEMWDQKDDAIYLYASNSSVSDKGIFNFVVTLFFEELNYNFLNAIGHIEAIIACLSKLNTLSSLHFGGILDIIYIGIPVRNCSKIKLYWNTMKMSKYSNKKWQLNDKLLPSAYLTPQTELYYSDAFNNNSFRILFRNETFPMDEEKKDYFAFYIECIKCPLGVKYMEIKSKIITNIDGKEFIFEGDMDKGNRVEFIRHLYFEKKEEFSLSKLSVEVHVNIYKIKDHKYRDHDETVLKYFGIYTNDEEIDDDKKKLKTIKINEYDNINMFEFNTSHEFETDGSILDNRCIWDIMDYINFLKNKQ